MRKAAFAALAGLLALGCATTRVDATWVAPNDPPPVKKVLVVGLASQTTWSRSFESEVAERLRGSGIEARALSAVTTDDLRLLPADESRERLREIVEREGFDSVLIGQILGATTDYQYVPTWTSFDPYWGGAWAMSPGYVEPLTTWRVETRLFEMKGQRELIWSMVTQSEDRASPETSVDELAGIIASELKKVGLLGKAPRVSTR